LGKKLIIMCALLFLLFWVIGGLLSIRLFKKQNSLSAREVHPAVKIMLILLSWVGFVMLYITDGD